jgi:histidinol dehydrogenase
MVIVDAHDRAALRPLYAGGWDPPREICERVAAIIADVRARGDAALVTYTRQWDDPQFSLERLRVDIPSRKHARALIPERIATGFELARERVEQFHARQQPVDISYRTLDGTLNQLLHRPLGSIGAYVPAGTAPLPSSLLMTVVPAKVARVERVVVTTPPARDGSINPAILFACSLTGVDELYAVGGAQAIAALTYGTATIAPVDKIVGPGNVYVTEAKRQVFGMCGIDGLAGPSEVLVVADERANPRFVAGELIAQAEHDPLARVAAVSRDRGVLEAVAALLTGDFARATGRGEIVERVLRDRTYLILAHSEADVLGVIERFAPEHLSLQIAAPYELVAKIRRAGAIFVGDDTPVAAGDYIAGSNHVLPTSGAARFSSGLHLADYFRTMSLIENSRARMAGDRETLAALAEFEGLPAHARTALMRDELVGSGERAAAVAPPP